MRKDGWFTGPLSFAWISLHSCRIESKWNYTKVQVFKWFEWRNGLKRIIFRLKWSRWILDQIKIATVKQSELVRVCVCVACLRWHVNAFVTHMKGFCSLYTYMSQIMWFYAYQIPIIGWQNFNQSVAKFSKCIAHTHTQKHRQTHIHTTNLMFDHTNAIWHF